MFNVVCTNCGSRNISEKSGLYTCAYCSSKFIITPEMIQTENAVIKEKVKRQDTNLDLLSQYEDSVFAFLLECDQFNIFLRAHDAEMHLVSYDCVTPMAVFFEVILKSVYVYFISDSFETDPNLHALIENKQLMDFISDKYHFSDKRTLHDIRKQSNKLKHDQNATPVSPLDRKRFFFCLYHFCEGFYFCQTGKKAPFLDDATYEKLIEQKARFVKTESPSEYYSTDYVDSLIHSDDPKEHQLSRIYLSDSQKAAAYSDKQYIAVVAGPGSGKTRVLTERIRYLVEERNVPETRILALSFSSKAANEVRKRLKQQMGIRALRIETKTFHSFGLSLIRQNGDLLGFNDDIQIIDPTQRNKVIRTILERERYSPDLLKFFEATGSAISNVKNGMQGIDQEIVRLTNTYNKKLRQGNYIDFDDMIVLARELLITNPTIRSACKGRYDHVLIDEVQDVNNYQIDVIRGILGPQTTLFVVGDDDQCIYEWRGAVPSYLRGLAVNDAFSIYHLEDNYRSEASIVKASASFISRNRDRIEKRIRSRSKRQSITSKAYAYRLVGEKDEARFIAETIESLVTNENYDYSDITILTRTHQQFTPILVALESHNIPYLCQENDQHYDAFIPVLRAVANINQKGMINRAINYPSIVMDNFDFQELQEKIPLSKDISVLEAFSEINDSDVDFDGSEIFRSRFSLIRRLNQHVNDYTVAEIIRTLFDYYSGENNRNEEKKRGIQTLLDFAHEFDNGYSKKSEKSIPLNEFLDYLQLAEEDTSAEKSRDHAVNLLTCHRSKGLEFPVVFIPGIQSDTFPNVKFIHSESAIEAERRLLYVSLTRAIDRVYVTCNNDPFVPYSFRDGKGNLLTFKGFMADLSDLVLNTPPTQATP